MNAAPPHPTSFGTRSGLRYLRDAVAAYFESHVIEAVVTPVGLKYRSFTLNQSNPTNANRVVFIPGEFDGSLQPRPRKYGTLSRSSRNHASVNNPRELLQWERPFTISVWSAPAPGKQFDEGESTAIVEDLLEQVARAVCGVDGGSIRWGDITINAPPVENAFGVELLVVARQQGPIYDVTYEVATGRPGDIDRQFT